MMGIQLQETIRASDPAHRRKVSFSSGVAWRIPGNGVEANLRRMRAGVALARKADPRRPIP